MANMSFEQKVSQIKEKYSVEEQKQSFQIEKMIEQYEKN